MHVWNWSDICRPKEEGGFGIRRVKDINSASGFRLVWRLCTSNSLWAQWMSVHYLKGLHLYQASSSLLDSGTWKWICSMKGLALSYMAKLGNGEECSLVFNRWLANTSDILIQNLSNTQLPNDVQNTKVSEIIEQGSWTCKFQFLQPIWHLILHQSIPTTSDPDTWSWVGTKTGEFSFSSAWNLARDSDQKFEFADMILKDLGTIPKD